MRTHKAPRATRVLHKADKSNIFQSHCRTTEGRPQEQSGSGPIPNKRTTIPFNLQQESHYPPGRAPQKRHRFNKQRHPTISLRNLKKESPNSANSKAKQLKNPVDAEPHRNEAGRVEDNNKGR